jgi:exopolysaccharide production protein ExoZ
MKSQTSFGDKPRQIHSIQWLRGLAAMAVVLLHASGTIQKYHISIPWFKDWAWGRSGVDLFFLISGFIMVYTTRNMNHGIETTLRFWGRRFIRIAPPYWILTTVAVAISVLSPAMTDYRPSVDHIIASYSFIPWLDLRGIAEPPVRVGWSLNFEAFFYLMFGLALLLPRRWLPAALLIWATMSVLLGLVMGAAGPIPTMLTSPLLLEFVAGAMIACLWLKGRILPVWLGLIAVVVGLAAIYQLDRFAPAWPEAVKFGIPSILILAGAVGIEHHLRFPERSFFESLGNWSYSIYLTHVLSLACFGKIAVALKVYEFLPSVVILLVDLGFVVAVGAAMSLLVERPLHDWMFARMFGAGNTATRSNGSAMPPPSAHAIAQPTK